VASGPLLDFSPDRHPVRIRTQPHEREQDEIFERTEKITTRHDVEFLLLSKTNHASFIHDRRGQVKGLDFVLKGDGPITVVFEDGIATPLEEWDAVPSDRYTCTSTGLRPSDGELGGPSASRSVSEILDDLDGLLRTLDLKPPYVFVGQSW